MISQKSFLIIVLVWLSLASNCRANSNNRKSSIYPIRNLESSLAASASQASVVAVRCDDCVVIVSMSPRQQQQSYRPIASDDDGMEEEDDKDGEQEQQDEDIRMDMLIPVLSRGPVQTYQYTASNPKTTSKVSASASRIMHILQKSSGLGLFMTGFSADTQYLVRYAASQISEHEHLQAGAHFYAQSLVRDVLAPRLRDATMGGGSRPFGVQALAVSSHSQPGRSMQIVTTDPSGNYRYWHGVGTGIGKDSNLIKKHLQQIVEGEAFDNPRDWSEALDVCMRSLLETVEESQNMKETPTEEILEELDALVIFDKHKNEHEHEHRRPYSCAVISRDATQMSFRKCFSLMKSGEGRTQ